MLLNLDGSRVVKDHIENCNLTIPMTTSIPTFLVPQTDDDLLLLDDEIQPSHTSLKRKRTDSDSDSVLLPPPSPEVSSTATEVLPLLRHYAHVCGVNMNETILENAELCGTNLAVKLMQLGADTILEEIHQNTTIVPIA